MSSSTIFLTISAFCILSVVLATEYNKYGGHHHSYYQPLKVKTYGSGYHESYGKDYHNDKPESYYHSSYEPKYEDYHKKEPSYTPYYGSSYHHDDYSKPEYYGSKYEQPKYDEYHGGHDDHYYGSEHH